MQASPLARGLFHRASGQSGGDHLRMRQMALVARAWDRRRAANAGGRD